MTSCGRNATAVSWLEKIALLLPPRRPNETSPLPLIADGFSVISLYPFRVLVGAEPTVDRPIAGWLFQLIAVPPFGPVSIQVVSATG